MSSITQPSNVQGVLYHPPLFIEIVHEVDEVMGSIVSVVNSFVFIVAETNLEGLVDEEHVAVDGPGPAVLGDGVVALGTLD